MADVNPTFSVITWNVNTLTILIKCQNWQIDGMEHEPTLC